MLLESPPKLLVSGDLSHIRPPARQGDVGYDIAIADSYKVGRQIVYMHTGVFVKIPDGYWGRLCGRSSTLRNHGIAIVEGIIDTNYTGELLLAGYSVREGIKTEVWPGARLGQLIMFRSAIFPLEHVEKLPETERGDKGFGSTGT